MTVTELLEKIRNAGAIPNTGALGAEDADLLGHADDALTSLLLPRLLNTREDYYTLRERATVTAGINSYRLPTRAAFNKLRAISFLTAADMPPAPMIKLEAEDMPPTGTGIDPIHYRIEGNRVFLLPSDASYTGFLEFAFYQSPGRLVTADNSRRITAVDVGTRTITLDSDVPTGWTTANTFDIHSGESGAELLLWSAAASAVSGDDITFTSSYPLDGSRFGTTPPAIGDYVVLAGKAALPCLPSEMHDLLVRATVMHFANSVSNTEKYQTSERLLAANLRDVSKTLEERNEGEPITLGREGSIVSQFNSLAPRHRA